MYLSEFISRNLECELPIIDCDSICRMCGKSIIEGVKQKDIIKKSTFTDYQYLKYNSDILCVDCCALIGTIKVNGKKTWLRNFSFICADNGLLFLKRHELLEHILNPPEPPFVYVITYTNKKHIAFKSEIQHNNECYKIFTDKGEVIIEPEKLKEITKIIQSWYSILPGKEESKQQPTYFTKGEILSGAKNMKNIQAYGLHKYIEENKFLGSFRNTALLKLLVFAVNKC
jgi:CRISPR type IV-associated protein Csf1